MLELGFQRTRLYPPHDFCAQLSGWCTLQLYRAMVDEPDAAAVVDWCASPGPGAEGPSSGFRFSGWRMPQPGRCVYGTLCLACGRVRRP